MDRRTIINRMQSMIPIRSHMTSYEASELLHAYSPCPQGSCVGNNELKISYDLQIIIPAYNVEKFIEECLNSVKSQKTKYNVLVTIVDDGSTDNTAKIINDIIQNPSENIVFELIIQQNKGISGARNTALKILKGNYIMFLDSDDLLVDQAIDQLLDAAYKSHVDVVQGNWYEFNAENNQCNNISVNTLSGYPWGKIYKATLLKNFQFPEGYWFEDTPLSFIIARMDMTYKIIPEIIYAYRLNPEGITSKSQTAKKCIDSYYITELCLREFPEFDLKYDERAYDYFLHQSIMNIKRAYSQPKEVRKALFTLTYTLMGEYFQDMHTQDVSLKDIEQCLRQHLFLRFETIVFPN
ncbi:Glycosyl transferase family 2 [Sharpea azabuensis]|uniref:glycosyltransferase family 2 protein n=1 Tax=Sharpea azabuensis TaxID=322505 RepID=UPI0008E1DD64|nr:glycosyltransferase family A protein [Sharpea azabuensis]SFD57167.1 Glycosyl transferase family 2 [Sharpea azabuensis]SFK56945.1 Glycosyl transferase family 2 [Sharpea azabuensis]